MRGRLRCFCAEMKCACTRLCAHVTFLMWCSRVRRTSPHSIDVHRHLPRSSRVSPDLSTRTIARTADIFSTAHPLHPSDVTFINVPSSRWSVRVWSSFCVIIAHSCALARALLRTHARTLALAHALWQTRARSCAHARALARQSRAALATERLPKSNPGCSETKTCKLLTVPSQIADCSVSKRGVFHCADFLVSLKVPYK
jgi:hypothetical protein